tara:strand:- start:269 stop:460 length:192 start_codon:yes stop_codon:yes gene_type:complete
MVLVSAGETLEIELLADYPHIWVSLSQYLATGRWHDAAVALKLPRSRHNCRNCSMDKVTVHTT